jgi:hypothetical protein
MSAPTVRLSLDGSARRFAPGDTVTGSVIVTCPEDWTVATAEVMLFWRTEGKGDQDTGVAGTLELAKPGATAGRALQGTFAFTLPQMPWTYHGRALKIHWVVGAYARPRMGKEVADEVAIVAHPQWREMPDPAPGA